MSFSTPKQTRARATRGHEIQFRTLRRSLAFKYILSNPSLLFGTFLETILERGAASFREPPTRDLVRNLDAPDLSDDQSFV